MNSPTGNITLAELAADLQQSTQGSAPRPKPSQRTGAAFPIDCLPTRLQDLIKDAELSLGMPPDFLAAGALIAAGIASGNTCELELKAGTTQRPIFFLVLIGNPNCNKSGALRFALKPITKRDGENYPTYKQHLLEWESTQRKGKGDDADDDLPKPVYLRHLVQDATPEALAATHFDNIRGIAVHRDELAGWVHNFDRYNGKGETEQWLTLWNGDPLTIDRKQSGALRIEKTYVSVAGTIQPAALEALAADGKGQNGFIDRFLFVWPDGLTKPLWTDQNVSLPLVNAYETAISRLLSLEFADDGSSRLITLAPDARQRLFQFFNSTNKPLCDDAPNELLAGINGKFDFHAARLAIALHLIEWAYNSTQDEPPGVVDLPTVERAIKIGEYFREQSLKVYSALHESSPVEKLPRDKQALMDALPDVFAKADGASIAQRMGINPKTFSRMLTDRRLFEKVRHGQYCKLY